MKNLPTPYINPLIQQKLTELGGLVPFGEDAGKPKIKIVWGPNEELFLDGKMRPRFVEFGQGQYIYKRWFVSLSLFSELSEWVQKESPKHPNPAEPVRLAKFFETANKLEFIPLEDSDNPHSETICPEGYLFVSDLDEYFEVLQPYWFILQWISPEQMPDTLESWNLKRWDIAFCPEVQKEVFLDCLGEFPSKGGYFHILKKFYRENDGTKTAIEPTYETAVLPIEQMIRARDEQSQYERQKDVRDRNFFEKMDTAAKAQKRKDWQTYDEIAEDLRPAFSETSDWVTVSKQIN